MEISYVGQIEIAITPKSPDHADFCISQGELIVERIASYLDQSGRKKRQTSDADEDLPSAYQYIVGAISVPSSNDAPDSAPLTATMSVGLFATITVITWFL